MAEIAISCLASGAAGGIAVAVMNPLDTLKVRYQVSTEASGMQAFAKSIVSREGLVRGLWSPGIVANSLGIAISSMGRVGAYPYVRDLVPGEPSKLVMFCAGLVAGGIGYFASSPVYQVKTLAQAEAGIVEGGLLVTGNRVGQKPVHHTRSLAASLGELAKNKALFRGSGALVIRGAFLSAGQQLGYDGCKTEARKSNYISDGPVLHSLASVAGAFGAAVFSTPADVVMTRYQSSREFTSVVHCARSILTQDGPLAFYRGFAPFFIRLCPVFVISLPLTEQLRKLCGLAYI